MRRNRSLAIADRDGHRRIVAEDYYYKSDTYYRILSSEVSGEEVIPSSRELLEAFVVPVCLEKARGAGMPVCSWEISYGYTPIPAIVYGINYFSDPAEYSILRDEWVARQVIRHITNNGKYPFCYQPISQEAEVYSIVSILGSTTQADAESKELAEKVYRIFRIPLVNIVLVREGSTSYLSSLSPVKYFKLTKDESKLLKERMEGATPWER
ncbi:RimK-like ATPgrasp N-terminal domain-containing protein [Methanothrix sp.]|uniref:RimK-like ATPgrasp N-terminal domain-containing protein n=1 Tax=Methanothrix sp. TaxID=90426 RepID=UPI0034E20563